MDGIFILSSSLLIFLWNIINKLTLEINYISRLKLKSFFSSYI